MPAHRPWWRTIGSRVHLGAEQLLITCDGDSSSSSRSRPWKVKLQGLADKLGLQFSVSHLPPCTSKWTKIEHQMVCHITQDWPGRPLVSHEVVVKLIGSFRTQQGLTIQSALEENRYETGRKITNEEMESLSIPREEFHAEWSYVLMPRP